MQACMIICLHYQINSRREVFSDKRHKLHKQQSYQAVVVGKRLGDEDVGELLHQDPLAVQELQVRHGEPLQVVRPEPVERHQQQRRRTLLSRVVFRGQSSYATQEAQQYFQ